MMDNSSSTTASSNSNSTTENPTKQQTQDRTEEHPVEFKRPPNREESHPFILNLFFCFFFPYVCRVAPIKNEHIPPVARSDRSDHVVPQVSKKWDPKVKRYLEELDKYNTEKNNPEQKHLKPPKQPSLAGTVASNLLSWKLLVAIISLYLGLAFNLLQPTMMRLLTEDLNDLARDEDIYGEIDRGSRFPYAPVIVIILCPLGRFIFDGLAFRFFFHFCGQIRSALSGLIYNKTLNLRMTATTNVNTGRLMTLMSTDARQVGESVGMLLLIFEVPVQFFVAFALIVSTFGWCTFVAWAVLAIVLPTQMIIASRMNLSMRMYLAYNDGRNKVVNETLQGIRVVKYTGLEDVFIGKVDRLRLQQVPYSFWFTFFQQLMFGILRTVPVFVNVATFSSYVYSQDITQLEFPVKVMHNIGYLTVMTQPTNQLPMIFNAFSMTIVSLSRIQSFLLLPQSKDEPYEPTLDSANAVEIVDASFRWPKAPEIPLTAAEKKKIHEEAKRRKMISAQQLAAERAEGHAPPKHTAIGQTPIRPVEATAQSFSSKPSLSPPASSSSSSSSDAAPAMPPRIVVDVPMTDSSASTAPDSSSAASSSSSSSSSGAAGESVSSPPPSGDAAGSSETAAAAERSPAVFAEEQPTVPASESTVIAAGALATPTAHLPRLSEGGSVSPAPHSSPGSPGQSAAVLPESTPGAGCPVATPGHQRPSGMYSPSPSPPVSVFGMRGTPSPSPSPTGTPMDGEQPPTLRNINLSIKKGSLTMVIGGVGSGKSSIGSVILRDIDRLSGSVRVSGSISYCAQTAWINNNTVRGNITFGLPYDAERYNHIVHCCCLEPDFQQLAAGDETSIGEKGVNLSGGQKARIQLARAVYANRDVYVLDDPLSAVDAHVGRTLFLDCIMGELVEKGKTVILMTNQLTYLNRADTVVLMSYGEIVAACPYSELKSRGIDLSQFIISKKGEKKKHHKHKKGKTKKGGAEGAEGEGAAKDEEMQEESESEGGDEEEGESDSESESESESSGEEKGEGEKGESHSGAAAHGAGDHAAHAHHKGKKKPEERTAKQVETAKKMMTEEEQETGGVSYGAYFSYFLALMNPFVLILFVTMTIIIQGDWVFAQYWLGVIGNPSKFSSLDYDMKIIMYLIFGIIGLVLNFLRCWISAYSVRRANIRIHRGLLRHVIHCPVSFFDTTPMGRVLNRFTGDIGLMDNTLFFFLMQVVTFWINIVGQVIVVAVDTPVFTAIGFVALFVFYCLMQLYARTSRNLQRLESMSRSPVLSLFSETLNGAGLSTIRAYGLEGVWREHFYNASDEWTIRFVLFRQGQRWVTVYSSLISVAFMAGVTLLGWFTMDVSEIAVAINSAISFSAFGVLLVQQNTELESRMTGYERIRFYSNGLPQEEWKPGRKGEVVPEESWPQKGAITFDNVSFRYRPGLPYVLRDVNFDIHGGEKIGVCGRTGAGKSSLLYALFRLVELDPNLMPKMVDVKTGFTVEVDKVKEANKGRVLIDGVDISKVNLSRLRRSIAIIPQDPTLFTGTLRYNLDLAHQRSDDEIWEVLELIEMKDIVLALEQQLDTQVAEGGSNFSCGQRQLICFGRAILNNCKIVIMDEATANVDVETDAKIQYTIRNVFKEQTVFVIAHRLNTIINSDRILVMEAGNVKEFDTPENLQNNPDSAFNALIRSTQS